MGKRSTDNLRSASEIRQSTIRHYGGYVAKPSKANPIFTRKPYSKVMTEVGK